MARATPHDLFEIDKLFEELCALLESAELNFKGLFLKADSGFNAQALRIACEKQEIEANIISNPCWGISPTTEWTYFDEELYKRRTLIEGANAWLDSFKALLVRYGTNVESWLSFHWLAFVVLFL